jgi:PPK2 family polyphosphate:nucleotide phosphotransferase
MDRHRIAPGAAVDLASIDTGATPLAASKSEGKAEHQELQTRLAELQEVLYAEQRHKVLVVLQAMDTGGKDGVVRHVLRGLNPSGVRVTSFKAPSDDELAHDYLWRIHHHSPMTGQIAVFNRSHYEDVLIVRVHDIVPDEVWRRRYDHIVAFERMLADEGTTIVKLFLHISKDEQRKRLQSRLDDPNKRWKFNEGDLAERKCWDDYQAAYAEAIERTCTEQAPWYVVPADHKWYRNLVAARILVDVLEGLDMHYPDPPDIEGVTVD